MKKFFDWLTVFSFVLSISPAPSVLAQPLQDPEEKIFLAILDLKNNAGLKPEECSTLSDAIRQEFFSTGKYRIVDRKNMDQILKEQGLQVSDCISGECVVRIGQLLGVKKMAFGSIGKLGDNYILAIQLVNVETGEIEKMASRRFSGSVGELITPITQITQELFGRAVKTEEPTLVVAPNKEVAAPQPQLVGYGTLEIGTFPQNCPIYIDSLYKGLSPQTICQAT